jgi:hypothetical protein
MSSSVTRNVYLRPMMSPRRPKKIAPNGANHEARGECRERRQERRRGIVSFGKNCVAMMVASAAEDVEVVPLDERAGRRRADDDEEIVLGFDLVGHAGLRRREEDTGS